MEKGIVEFRKITLVGGGGFMGRSLAQKMASSGIDVTVLEVSEERIAQAREAMANSLDDELRRFRSRGSPWPRT